MPDELQTGRPGQDDVGDDEMNPVPVRLDERQRRHRLFRDEHAISVPLKRSLQKRAHDVVVGSVSQHNLLLGPAERADVIIDFSQFAGKTIILYNDSPAAMPAADSRVDYFTADLDHGHTGDEPNSLFTVLQELDEFR